jgi:hypothetical protein
VTTTKGTRRSLVSLKLPKAVPALITYAQGIVTSMTNNAHFTTPVPPLSALSAAVTDLANAETAALARTKGAVALRNEKRTTLVSLLTQLRGYVQVVADANPRSSRAPVSPSARPPSVPRASSRPRRGPCRVR